MLATACARVPPAGCDDARIWKLSREGFLQELLFPEATPRTPRFDAYTAGSYQVDKLDVLRGVRALRASRPEIVGLVVRDPSGPLSSHTMLFLRQDDHIRANVVAFTHARIVAKGTTVVAAGYDELLDEVAESSALTPGLPSFETSGRERMEDLPRDWRFDLLIVDWSRGFETVWHARAELPYHRDPAVAALLDRLDSLTRDLTVTYASDLPGRQTIYRDVPEP